MIFIKPNILNDKKFFILTIALYFGYDPSNLSLCQGLTTVRPSALPEETHLLSHHSYVIYENHFE